MTAIITYSTGTVSVAAGGTTVTGVSTIWSGVNVRPGDVLQIGNFQTVIGDVTDTTHLVIPPWGGGVQSGVAYTIFQVSPQRFAGAQAMADVSALVAALNTAGYFVFVDSSLSVPDPSLGNNGQFAFQPSTGKLWTKTGGSWVPASSPIAGYGGTSSTSLVIANSVTRVFTTQLGLAYNGARVRAASAAAPANFMEGICSYSGSTLTMTVDTIGGSGTKTDWVFSIGSGAGALQPGNNLSDVATVATARGNLGINQTIPITGAVDLNTVVTTGGYYCSNNTCTNGPTVGGQWYIEVQVYGGDPTNYVTQRATSLLADATIYTRNKVSGAWSAWQGIDYAIAASPFKIVAFTHVLSAASGSQSVTGVGFKPRLIQFQSGITGGAQWCSFGQSNVVNNTCSEIKVATGSVGAFFQNFAIIQRDDTAGSNYNTASVTSMDADGFTLSWTKTGSPTATVSITALCYR